MSQDAAAGVRKPWWHGARGEWLVVIQVFLMGLVFFGPRTFAGEPSWPFPFSHVFSIAGGVLMLVGGVLFISGLVRLGPRSTPLPYPKVAGRLIQTGPYAIVRHPIYSGGLVLALGWALYIQGWLTLGYVLVLFAFLDMKSRREETWLTERYPEYTGYQKRVRKLIPFVY